MVIAHINGDHRHVVATSGWICPLSQDRPIYNCPKCKEEAMQFHHQLNDQPGREGFYRCCACGLFWEM